jgi:hypothetical protein
MSIDPINGSSTLFSCTWNAKRKKLHALPSNNTGRSAVRFVKGERVWER